MLRPSLNRTAPFSRRGDEGVCSEEAPLGIAWARSRLRQPVGLLDQARRSPPRRRPAAPPRRRARHRAPRLFPSPAPQNGPLAPGPPGSPAASARLQPASRRFPSRIGRRTKPPPSRVHKGRINPLASRHDDPRTRAPARSMPTARKAPHLGSGQRGSSDIETVSMRRLPTEPWRTR